MATFFIRTNSETSYEKIQQQLISRGLIHSKKQIMDSIEIEILGTPEDFKFFMKHASDINNSVGSTSVVITEGI